MYKYLRMTALLLCDALLVALSVYLAYLLRFDFSIRPEFVETLPYVFSMYSIFILICFYVFKIYKRIWQYASVGDIIAILKGALVGTIAFFSFHQFVFYSINSVWVVPRSIYLLTAMMSFLFVGGSRFFWRLLRDEYVKIQPHHRRALVVGAGEVGVMVVRELKHSIKSELYPVVFIDDDLQKQSYEVLGIPVAGTRKDIQKIVKHYKIDDIIVAIPTASKSDISAIINLCKSTGCQIKIVPRVNDLINGKISLNMIRDVSVEDLLGREPVKVDLEEIAGYVKEQVILVTGAGGSIGSEISRQISCLSPKQLIILDHSENSIYDIEIELRGSYPSLDLVAVIADVKDRERLEHVFNYYEPQVVFHAAAHKHVPLMEENPGEAVKNNVFGTKNVAECAHQYRAKRFILISTDKAVNPTSVMGATKRVAEMLVQDLDVRSETLFSAVRFGNVLGSRGSVIPLFKKQIENGGPVTVTHQEMVRYFMTIPEAVQLVIQAGAITKGGETFILDMGKPVKISDLAHDLIRLSGLEPNKDVKIIYTGIRPGEKLFEEILSKEEGATTTKHDRIYVGKALDISSNFLKQQLVILENTNSSDDVRAKLKQLVPAFKWNHEANKESLNDSDDRLRAALEVVASLEQKTS